MNPKQQQELLELLKTQAPEHIKKRVPDTGQHWEETKEHLVKPMLNAAVTSALPCLLLGLRAFPIVFIARLFWVVMQSGNKH